MQTHAQHLFLLIMYLFIYLVGKASKYDCGKNTFSATKYVHGHEILCHVHFWARSVIFHRMHTVPQYS